MLVPETTTLTHLLVTMPEVQPVVRPTSLTVAPTAMPLLVSLLVTVKLPSISREPLLAPLPIRAPSRTSQCAQQ